MKHITITLTEDQARILIDDQEDRVKNHKAWIKLYGRIYDISSTEKKIAFRLRLLDKLKQELM
jgi:hypothetical protein